MSGGEPRRWRRPCATWGPRVTASRYDDRAGPDRDADRAGRHPASTDVVAVALEAGLSAEDILGVLRAVAPQVSTARVVAAAPELMLALGLPLPGDDDDPRRRPTIVRRRSLLLPAAAIEAVPTS